MMRFRAALFDLDGTLVDSLNDIADAMNAVLEERGFARHDPAAYRYMIGDGMDMLVLRALPDDQRDPVAVRDCAAAMRHLYARRWFIRSRPYAGIPELLSALERRGVKLAVLSNKPQDFTELMVRRFFPEFRFESIRGIQPGIPPKPDPLSALQTADALAVSQDRMVYMGDSAVDMKTAVSAGMYPVGVLWGYRTASELIHGGARLLVRQPEDLLAWV
jgi:phosphoglycolate phosphatase